VSGFGTYIFEKAKSPPPLIQPLGLNIDSCITNSNETNKPKWKSTSVPRRLLPRLNHSSMGWITVRDRSLFIVQGGIEEKLGGALNFLKPEGGGLWKNTERRKKGDFEKIYQFEKTLVVLKCITNIKSLLCSCK
jgi:hypothetical protein